MICFIIVCDLFLIVYGFKNDVNNDNNLFQQSEKAALLFRQYVKDSLYDRISTRPFLNSIEKKWIAFQMLCALNQCHKVKVNLFLL